MKCNWCGKYTPEHSVNGLKRCQESLRGASGTPDGIFPREYVANLIYSMADSLTKVSRPLQATRCAEIYEAIEGYDIKVTVQLIPKRSKLQRGREFLYGDGL